MKKITLSIALIAAIFSATTLKAQIPAGVKPAHIVFVLEENYAYSEIVGGLYSSYAPTFNKLAKDSTTVTFTQMYAITHPSEPNYLDLFSGSNQGVIVDESGPDASAPFNNCNLGSALIIGGYSFIGYSETQPSVGWIATDSPPYYTKHCPWINWMNGDNGNNVTGPDSVPLKSDLPMFPLNTYYPDSLHYNTLPTVAWVIPNCSDDMHDPSSNPATAISNGDAWFKANMMPLINWAKNPANNTLVIIVWDEDDYSSSNNVPMFFCGGLVAGGKCTAKLNHYDVLKTVEDIYKISLCGSASSGVDVPPSVWKVTIGINSITAPVNEVVTWPVPATNVLNVKVTSVSEEKDAKMALYDVTGKLVKEISVKLTAGANFLSIPTDDVSNGMYFLNITGENINVSKKVVVQK